MIDYCSKDKRYGIDRSKERLRRAEEQYHARISEAGLILATGVLIIIIGVYIVYVVLQDVYCLLDIQPRTQEHQTKTETISQI